MTVIILPTFGFTSIEAVLRSLSAKGDDDDAGGFPWECIFLPDSGAFFVNYVITAALVGCGMELIRLADVIIYSIYVCYSRSKAETDFIRNVLAVYEFQFGEQYARMMMIFCMTVIYSILCPLITPFGLLYFVNKHYTDRHNLMFARKPSKISKKVHSTAINFVVLCTLILQFIMMIFYLIRPGSWDKITLISKFAIGCFLLSVNIYSAQLWSDTCQKLSPIEYLECTYIREDDFGDEKKKDDIYLPITLMSQEEKQKYREFVAFKESKSSFNSRYYGSFGSKLNKYVLMPKKIIAPLKRKSRDP